MAESLSGRAAEVKRWPLVGTAEVAALWFLGDGASLRSRGFTRRPVPHRGCNRASCHIVIDSHAVTKERYGFRVTPFSIELLQEVRPTLICMLYTEPSVVMDRIRSNNQGRPTVTAFEAAFHCELQASVALIYGINLGLPVYLLDSSKSADSLTAEVLRLMGVFVEQRALDM